MIKKRKKKYIYKDITNAVENMVKNLDASLLEKNMDLIKYNLAIACFAGIENGLREKGEENEM